MDPYDALYRAIGRVVYEWAWLENDVASLLFDICTIHSPSFYREAGAAKVAVAINADLDLKANIALSKSLAHQIDDIAGFFGRVEAALNPINNELRNERNRFVHDKWHTTGGQAFRYKAGTVIKREKGSGNTTLEFVTRKHFESIGEVEAFADLIADQRQEVMALSDEAQEIYRLRYPEEE